MFTTVVKLNIGKDIKIMNILKFLHVSVRGGRSIHKISIHLGIFFHSLHLFTCTGKK